MTVDVVDFQAVDNINFETKITIMAKEGPLF